MARKGPLATVRATVLKLDPSHVQFELHRATRDHGWRGAWTVDSLPANAVAAWNAGQFTGPTPWGWLVRNGREEQPPASGPLAMAFVVDREGRTSLIAARDLARHRAQAELAFQSYSALLVNGAMPWELRAKGRGVRLGHRDSRVAIGILRDGSVLVVLTRFTALGEAGAELPWGPTLPEMAAWMRAQGCRNAMMLDGGLSSQMAVRGRDGSVSQWTNLRAVPLGMVVRPRTGEPTRRVGPVAASERAR
jgi:exopolysaccharide biosynthesis protein